MRNLIVEVYFKILKEILIRDLFYFRCLSIRGENEVVVIVRYFLKF